MTLVRTIKIETTEPCLCGNWFFHWKNFSKQYTDFCVVEGCHNTDVSGAHVTCIEMRDENQYIVPLCRAHKQSEEVLKIAEKCALVSANMNLTCRKTN